MYRRPAKKNQYLKQYTNLFLRTLQLLSKSISRSSNYFLEQEKLCFDLEKTQKPIPIIVKTDILLKDIAYQNQKEEYLETIKYLELQET
jgi:hypothetical protein